MPSPSISARLQDAGAALHLPRGGWDAVRSARPGNPRRTGLFVAIGIAGVLAIIYLTLRLTPLSTVQRVTVVGVQGPDATEIRNAIERASLGQSTLGFGDAAVKRAVADTASITGVQVHTKFPHGVQVEVQQLLAVGAIEVDGKRVAVSADGRLLPDWDVGKLPLIRGARTERGLAAGGARDATAILGLAPTALIDHVARVDNGTTVRLADGPALLFRDTKRLNAKWAAAVAVLNDPGTRGATWIDLRVPEQPVAGQGAPPGLPSGSRRIGRDGVPKNTPAGAGRTGDGDGATAAAGTSASGAETPATARTATPSSGTTAPAQGTAVDPSAPGADATPSTAATGTGGTPAGASSPASGGGTSTAGTGTGTNSGVTGTGTAAAGTAGGASPSGGGTAPTGQTAP